MKTLIFITLGLVACQSNKQKDQFSLKNDESISINEEQKDSIYKLEIFKSLPKDLEIGGVCSFYPNKESIANEFYLLVNDMSELAFVKVNSQLTSFKLKEYDEKNSKYVYLNKKFKLEVIVQSRVMEGENYYLNGIIILYKGSQKCDEVNFVGLCSD